METTTTLNSPLSSAPSGILRTPAELPGNVRSRCTTTACANMGRRILLVEDDPSLADLLAAELEHLRFAVELLQERGEVLAALRGKGQFDLLLLDMNLSGLDGMSLIGRLRPVYPRLPLLALTAGNRVEDKVSALQNGADDCLAKPFSLAELLARVQALLRRNTGTVPNCSKIADLSLLREERVVQRNGRRIHLTRREFAILDLMMRNAGRPVSRATLLAQVWNLPADKPTNIVDVYMKYIRDKIDGPGERRLTHTVRGFGYELRDSDG